MNEVLNQIEQFGVVPVVAIDDADHALGLGRALLDGGLPCAEITFRTAAAGDISPLARCFSAGMVPERLLPGLDWHAQPILFGRNLMSV